jgi:tRNA-dihydrouridine synthase 3
MDAAARQDFFRDAVLLAPLTKGGNLPFRRLAVEFGATTTCGEMAVARFVVKRTRSEMALLRRAPAEARFGAQLAGRDPQEMARAAQIAVERGATFVDVNLGCPIDVFCRRGLGAALMRKPGKVASIVSAMRAVLDVPLTVKIRLGYDEDKPRFLEVARAAEQAGADAITLHGRSRAQRYARASSWEAIGELVRSVSVPVIGNGDLLTWRDVEHRRAQTGCAGVMLGRGALIKPWVFAEITQRRDHLLTPRQRLDVARRYRALALEHFGDDERGRTRVREFLHWHFDFFNRYRPIPSAEVDPDAHPLIQTRDETVFVPTDELDALLHSTQEPDRARLTELLMAELDEDPEGAAEWNLRPASSILAPVEGASISP